MFGVDGVDGALAGCRPSKSATDAGEDDLRRQPTGERRLNLWRAEARDLKARPRHGAFTRGGNARKRARQPACANLELLALLGVKPFSHRRDRHEPRPEWLTRPSRARYAVADETRTLATRSAVARAPRWPASICFWSTAPRTASTAAPVHRTSVPSLSGRAAGLAVDEPRRFSSSTSRVAWPPARQRQHVPRATPSPASAPRADVRQVDRGARAGNWLRLDCGLQTANARGLAGRLDTTPPAPGVPP